MHLFEDVPDLRVAPLEHLLGRLDRVGQAVLLEPADDERLVQLQRDLLRQAALVQLELGADDDDRAGRVVDALAEQVLAEAALLALDHVGQRLQRAVAAPSTGRRQRPLSNSASTACWSMRFSLRMMTSGALRSTSFFSRLLRLMMRRYRSFRSRRREVAALQQHQRAQVRRDHRDHVHDHPLGLVLRVADGLDHLQALGQVLDLLLAVGLLDVAADLVLLGVEVEQAEQLLDRLGAHLGFEFVAVLLVGGAVLVLGEELLLLQRRLAGIGDDVVLEVDDLLDVAGLHVQQRAEARRQGLEEPDVHDRARPG